MSNIKGLGKNQSRIIHFLKKYPGWHSFSTDDITVKVINSLIKRGLLIVNEFNQFKRI